MKKLTWGVFSNNEFIDLETTNLLLETIKLPHEDTIKNLKEVLSIFYCEDAKKRGINIITELVFNYYNSLDQSKVSLTDIIPQWFVINNDETIDEISNFIMKRGVANGD